MEHGLLAANKPIVMIESCTTSPPYRQGIEAGDRRDGCGLVAVGTAEGGQFRLTLWGFPTCPKVLFWCSPGLLMPAGVYSGITFG